MTELKDLKVIGHMVCLELGFFAVYFSGYKRLWCCTTKADRAHEPDYKGPLFLAEIKAGNLGHDGGLNALINNWAITKYGSDEVENFMLEQAKVAGLKVTH